MGNRVTIPLPSTGVFQSGICHLTLWLVFTARDAANDGRIRGSISKSLVANVANRPLETAQNQLIHLKPSIPALFRRASVADFSNGVDCQNSNCPGKGLAITKPGQQIKQSVLSFLFLAGCCFVAISLSVSWAITSFRK